MRLKGGRMGPGCVCRVPHTESSSAVTWVPASAHLLLHHGPLILAEPGPNSVPRNLGIFLGEDLWRRLHLRPQVSVCTVAFPWAVNSYLTFTRSFKIYIEIEMEIVLLQPLSLTYRCPFPAFAVLPPAGAPPHGPCQVLSAMAACQGLWVRPWCPPSTWPLRPGVSGPHSAVPHVQNEPLLPDYAPFSPD